MRTFFRDTFSDPAALADLMVFGDREQAEFHGNRGVTKSKDKDSSGLYGLAKHSERLRRLQGPCGPGPSCIKTHERRTEDHHQQKRKLHNTLKNVNTVIEG